MARKKLSLRKRNTWSKHVALYKDVFCHSLVQLKELTPFSEKEDEISAVLLRILKQICKKWSSERSMEIPAPLAQLPQQNAEKAIEKGLNSLPRPDFTCPKFDFEKGENLFFDVECKLLGNPTSKTWIVNRNYVTEGIARFDCMAHEYGNSASSGMMIGYMSSMMPDDILAEVNDVLKTKYTQFPALVFKFKKEQVPGCEQFFSRTVIMPKNFRLIHLWVDLREQILMNI